MIQPWLNSPYAKGEAVKIRDYLLPNIIAFKTAINKELQEKVQEIHLIRNDATSLFVNSNSVTVFIRIDASEMEMQGYTETLNDVLMYHMANIGLSVRLCVYNLAWLDMSGSSLFWQDIKINSLLVWSRYGNKDKFITAKTVIDNVNEESIERGLQHDLAYENESLRQFITDVPKLDWANMQAAIYEPPIQYDTIPECFYSTIATHIRIWTTEYFLHMPNWIIEYLKSNPLFKQVHKHSQDYNDF